MSRIKSHRRYAPYGDTVRCAANTTKGGRCIRDATAQLGGKALCALHHNMAITEKLKGGGK